LAERGVGIVPARVCVNQPRTGARLQKPADARRMSNAAPPDRREGEADVSALPQTHYRKEFDMRFMVIVKATADSEAGILPTKEMFAEMGAYNEQLVKAGIMQAGEGLHPSSKGVRVRFSGKQRTVVDGPFAETKELVAGFWLWQCASLQEAVEWVKRCPNPMPGDSEIEIRQIYAAEDFGAEFTPELREQEERLRTQIEKKK
jgi:hypothetical protein